jgi:hypothetical protein
MTCPLCHRSDLPLLLIGLLFAALLATILVGYGARESLRAELRQEIAAQAGKQAVLVLNDAKYAVVHNHNGEWVATPEPLDLTPAKTNNKKGVSK